jgi:hypothetical protein
MNYNEQAKLSAKNFCCLSPGGEILKRAPRHSAKRHTAEHTNSQHKGIQHNNSVYE